MYVWELLCAVIHCSVEQLSWAPRQLINREHFSFSVCSHVSRFEPSDLKIKKNNNNNNNELFNLLHNLLFQNFNFIFASLSFFSLLWKLSIQTRVITNSVNKQTNKKYILWSWLYSLTSSSECLVFKVKCCVAI